MDPDSPKSDPKKAQDPPRGNGLGTFWAELKRRKVMRVAITYAVVAWLVIQVADTTFEGFGIPIWAFRFVMLCVILGFSTGPHSSLGIRTDTRWDQDHQSRSSDAGRHACIQTTTTQSQLVFRRLRRRHPHPHLRHPGHFLLHSLSRAPWS